MTPIGVGTPRRTTVRFDPLASLRLSHSWSFLGQSDPLIPGVLALEFCSRGRHVRCFKKFSSLGGNRPVAMNVWRDIRPYILPALRFWNFSAKIDGHNC
jgi:hypothetical protein